MIEFFSAAHNLIWSPWDYVAMLSSVFAIQWSTFGTRMTNSFHVIVRTMWNLFDDVCDALSRQRLGYKRSRFNRSISVSFTDCFRRWRAPFHYSQLMKSILTGLDRLPSCSRQSVFARSSVGQLGSSLPIQLFTGRESQQLLVLPWTGLLIETLSWNGINASRTSGI